VAVLFLLGVWTYAPAQGQTVKKFFIYIQNENGTPFYVRTGDSLMSSSSAGYIIIPRLTRGQHKFTIGFPGNQVPEESFSINMKGPEDKGFILKKNNKGFALFDLKDLKVLQPLAVASAPGNRIVNIPSPDAEPQAADVHKKNGDTSTSQTDDSGSLVMLKPSGKPKQQQATTVLPADTTVNAGDSDAFSKMLNEVTGTTRPATTLPASSQKGPPVSGISDTAQVQVSGADVKVSAQESSVDREEQNNLQADNLGLPDEQTARRHKNSRQKNEPQFITFLSDSSHTDTMKDSGIQETAVTDTNPDTAMTLKQEQRRLRKEQRRLKKEAEKQQNGLTEDTSSVPITTPQTDVDDNDHSISGEKEEHPVQQPAIANSDCQHLANEDDFQKVRRKMASRSSEEAMFHIAEKYFEGGICYSTAQVQSLTYLFMTDEYKYKFLEMAYQHTYDAAHFPSLGKTLGSDYYRGRFDAMIKK